MIHHALSYFLIRTATFPLALLPLKAIHALGRPLGTLLYHLYPKMRKRALSNLALSNLKKSSQEIRTLAKQSIQNLVLTCMEYPKLSFCKDLKKIVTCSNPDAPQAVLDERQGAVFFCGHQANWELLFLDSTSRYPGVAIGRPIKNRMLYNWITTIREKMGGKMIPPRSALKEGLRAMKQGKFIGIVGDQGMPDSGFSSPFFGRLAWTSPLPALLAYRTHRPIFVCTLVREKGGYITHYSNPLWPQQERPLQEEVERLMKEALSLLEKSIRAHPDQWLWTHNRWKQQLPGALKKQFRHETIAVILPDEEKELLSALALLPTLRTIYPQEFITLFAPATCNKSALAGFECRFYTTLNDILQEEHFQKLLFNFTSNKELNAHFKRCAALTVASLPQLHSLAGTDDPTFLEKALKAR